MALVVTAYGNFLRITGTIAEVLTEVSDQRITKAEQISYYVEDTGNAIALVGRLL